MRRAILLLAAIAVALVLVGGTSLANSDGAANGTTTAKPLETQAAPPPQEGLTAPTPVEDGKLEPQSASGGEGVSATASSTPEWQNGTTSNTYYWNPFFNWMEMLTTEYVGYWGAEDTSYPRVGELYYGKVVIANVNPSTKTYVVPNIQLPPRTFFAIDPNDPDLKVLCFLDNFETGARQELTGDGCDQEPSQGLYGAHFAPKKHGSTEHLWELKPGEMLTVIFPIFSAKELKGIAASPADCLIGAVFAAGGMGDGWDAPRSGDSCPLPKDHGVWQGVFVSFNPATISYPNPSATSITATAARTTATLSSHYNAGTAFVELGTTTSYGQTSSVAIPDTDDWFTVNTDWTGLKPGTTYHWRLRFVDTKGRTFTGADQTFTTSPDTVAPKVKRVAPVEDDTGIGLGANVSGFFSEAMKAGSINTNTVKLFKKGTTSALPAAVSYDKVAKKATLDPDAKLKRGATYKAVVTTGARDLAGNPLDQNPTLSGNQPKAWFFTVKN